MRNPNNADKIIVKRGLPNPNEGDNGDLSLNITKYGMGLYGKVNSKWYRFGAAQELGIQNTTNKYLKQDLSVKDLHSTSLIIDNSIKLKERPVASVDKTAYGQLWVKSDTPTSLYFTTDAGDDIQITSGTSITDSFVLNSADDTMAGTLTINKDVTSTDAGTYTGLSIDFDKTGSSTSNNTLYGLLIDADNTTATSGINILYGISNTPTLTHASDGGSPIVYGLRQLVTGVTNGSSTSYGISQTVTGSDTNIGIFQNVDNGGTDLKFRSSADGSDYFTLATSANGATTITTVDDDAALAHLTLDIDGDIILDAVCGNGNGVLLKNAGTTYGMFDIHHNATYFTLYEDGGASTDDYFAINVGGDGASTISTTDAVGTAAHINIEADGHVEFDGCGVGFDLVTPTFNATDTDVNFKTGNKQMVTLTDNLGDLNLTFPRTSGNFVLLLKQDGTGSRLIHSAGYLVFEHDGTAASGSSTVKFAGGSNPTLTTDANHVDILSFFWDSSNQICYGVATLDFQF